MSRVSTEALIMLAESVRDCPRPTCYSCRQAAVDVLEKAEPAMIICRVGGQAYRFDLGKVAMLVGAAQEVVGAWDVDESLDDEEMDHAVSTLADCLEEAEATPER